MTSSLEDTGRPAKAVDQSRWLMDLDDVPETFLHDVIIELLKLVLKYRYRDRNAIVTSNVACRWEPKDERVGVHPDVILLEPAPPEGEALKSLRVWEPGHQPPKLAIEIVSETNAAKDYDEGPLRLGRLGAEELWIFDPELHGPSNDGGPFVLQIWRRSATGPGQMEPVHKGDAPAFSPVLNAWVVTAEGGRRLRIADDAQGLQLWPTKDEAEAEERQVEAEARRVEAEARRVEAEARRVEAEARRAAEAEVQRLKALLDEATKK